MPVDEQVQQVLEYYATFGAPPLTTLSPPDARRRPTIVDAVNALCQQRGETDGSEVVSEVRDWVIQGPEGEIPVRIYRPESDGLLPLLVYLHDGGWVLGDLESCDATCRALANLARCLVVSVAYRLAPEHPFPAAMQDAYAASQWAIAAAPALRVDPTRVAIGGDGSGGNLAAAVAQVARDSQARMPVYQALICPVMNYAFDTPSYEHSAHVRPLTRAEMRWFWKHYLPDEAGGANPYASPLRADDLRGLPPALIITAEYDPLRDEGEAYGRRLEEAGVPTVVRRSEGMVHGLLDMAPVVERARSALLEIAAWLRVAFKDQQESATAEEFSLLEGTAAFVPVQEGLRMAVISERAMVTLLPESFELVSARLAPGAASGASAATGESASAVSAEAAAPASESAVPAGAEQGTTLPPAFDDRAPAEAAGRVEGVSPVPQAPLETGLVVRVGMEVVGSDGHRMGRVKAVRVADFVVDRRFRRDIALPFRAIHEAGDQVILNVPAKEATKTDWSQPA